MSPVSPLRVFPGWCENRCQLLGPAPMPLSRLKGQFRWHLTLLSASAGVLAQELLGVMERAEKVRPRGRVRIQVDMDPVSML